jgi:N-acetylglucosamine-6-phosphate deacetylase
MQMRSTLITNGKIIQGDQILEGVSILCTGSIIEALVESKDLVQGVIRIDAQGQFVSPGFIDLHVHGGGGHDFMDATVDAFLAIAKLHAQHGTTSLMPTTLTSSRTELERILRVYTQANAQNLEGAEFIGMHLEGPYINRAQAGAQDPRYIRNPDPSEYVDILTRHPHIRRWSAAPELPGALDLGRFLKSKSVLAAIAHSDAIFEEVEQAVKAGYTHVTHLYSAMSGVTRRQARRYAGVIESSYLLDELTVEIIADGIHVPDPLLRLAYKIKGAGKIALITDAMRAAGLPPGSSILGSLENGIPVIVEDGVAKSMDRSFFAGSVATSDRLVRTMVQVAGVPLPEAVRMMTATPASILGVENRKGSLAPGMDADLVIFDDQVHVSATIIGGRIVFMEAPITES